jgi:hypothetical protein
MLYRLFTITDSQRSTQSAAGDKVPFIRVRQDSFVKMQIMNIEENIT